MPTNAIKFVYGANTVYFDTEEVLDTPWGQQQEHQVHQRQASKPKINYIGSTVSNLSITFDLRREETLTKLDQIVDALEELTLYPSLQYDDTANIKVIPLIDGIEDVDTYGYQDATMTRTIQFLQSGS